MGIGAFASILPCQSYYFRRIPLEIDRAGLLLPDRPQTSPYAWGGNSRLSSSLLKRHGLYEGTTLAARRNWSAFTALSGTEAAQRGFAANCLDAAFSSIVN